MSNAVPMMKVRELQADEVDERVDSAARQRPDLDFGMMPLYFQLKRIVHALDQPRERFAAAHDLKVSDVGMLLVLRRGGPGYAMRPTDLYRKMLVTAGTITKQIDKLVERKLVKRINGERDGRSVRVQLTDRGQKVADDLWTFGVSMLLTFEQEAGISKSSREQHQLMLARWADAAEVAAQIELSNPKNAKRKRAKG